MRYGSIYMIKNTINDKVYIGQTCQSITERWKGHLKRVKEESKKYKLYNALRKHGVSNFSIVPLEINIPYDQLDKKEIEYIKSYDSFENGYNSTPGGDGKFLDSFDEGEIVSLYLAGLSSIELGDLYSISWRSVIRVLDKHEIERRNNRSFIDHDEFKTMYLNKIPLQDIADHFSINIKTVTRIRNKLELPKRKSQGERVETNL